MILTPKEQAIELVNDFVCFANLLPDQAIQCALLCVEKILDEWKKEGHRIGKKYYWHQVKQELEKL
jgi:hypothetical protein